MNLHGAATAALFTGAVAACAFLVQQFLGPFNFHSAEFGIFLVLAVGLYWTLADRRSPRNLFLLGASVVFYASYTWWYLGLILFSTLLDYRCGRVIAHSPVQRHRLLALLASLGGNLGLLGFFKYYDWGVESLQLGLAAVGVEVDPWLLNQAVPVGISFYTFQTLSYTIDIYRGVLQPARNLREFALFVCFFPQLVAGPIVRAREFLPQLELVPRFSRARLHDGLYRMGVGLAKKVLVADVLRFYLVDPVYARPDEYAPLIHLAALYAFGFQIYFDFSGYSDIAIGAGRLLGFDLPENFNGPFKARSFREFWRRWHITLSSWVRDYLYFPLGGSRCSEWKVARNLLVTMLIIGLWHGASSLWACYGLLNGTVMIVERRLEALRGGRPFAVGLLRNAVSWVLTYHLLILSFLFIRAQSWGEIGGVVGVFGEGYGISHWAWIALAAGAVTHFPPRWLHDGFQRFVCSLPTAVVGALLGILVGILVYLSLPQAPFIYFQF